MRGRAAAALAALAALSGCGSGDSPRATVLTLGVADPAGIEHAPGLTTFVAEVARVSHGSLRIAVDDRWSRRADPQDGPQSADERMLLRGVARGADDLAWAHTRTFDRLGVAGFQAVDAPLLIDDHATQAALLRSGLPARMLAGTRSAGLVGLALLAGRLDRPVGRGRPLRGPRDYRGLGLRTHDSAIHDATAAALGARPRHEVYVDVSRRWGEGDIAGLQDDLDALFFEQLEQSRGFPRPRAWVTVNVGLTPAIAALVANPRRLRRLSARQRGWLRVAAARATTVSLRETDDDDRLARELCAAGVSFATASPAQVEALRHAVTPVYARLRSRHATREVLRELEAIAHDVPDRASVAAPQACPTAAPRNRPGGGLRSTIPDGIYRARMTDADLRAARADAPDDVPATLTLTLRRGRWRMQEREPAGSVDRGTYAGDPLRTLWERDGHLLSARLSVVVQARGLRFSVGIAGDYAYYRSRFTRHLWLRIGD